MVSSPWYHLNRYKHIEWRLPEYQLLIRRQVEFMVQMPPAMLGLQCKMLQGSDLRSLLTWVVPLKWGLLVQALPLQVFLMTLFSDDPTLSSVSPSPAPDIHIGELANFELCLCWFLEAALLSRAELTDSVSLLSAGEALSWARPLRVPSCLSGMQVWWPNW